MFAELYEFSMSKKVISWQSTSELIASPLYFHLVSRLTRFCPKLCFKMFFCPGLGPRSICLELQCLYSQIVSFYNGLFSLECSTFTTSLDISLNYWFIPSSCIHIVYRITYSVSHCATTNWHKMSTAMTKWCMVNIRHNWLVRRMIFANTDQITQYTSINISLFFIKYVYHKGCPFLPMVLMYITLLHQGN